MSRSTDDPRTVGTLTIPRTRISELTDKLTQSRSRNALRSIGKNMRCYSLMPVGSISLSCPKYFR